MTSIRGRDLSVTDIGSGRPVIWGHGLTSSRAAEDRAGYFGWLAPRAIEGIRLVRYDAVGHGTSDAGSGEASYRWPELAYDMIALADQLGFARFVAAGASMGAATSLWAAVTDPSRLDGLVLVIPPTAWESRPAQREVYRAGADLVESEGIDALADARDRLAPAPLFASHPDVLALQRQNLLENDARVLPSVYRGAADSDLPEPDALRDVDLPALILAWEGDPVHPVSTAEELSSLLRGSELHVAADLDSVRRSWPEIVRRFLTRFAISGAGSA